MGVVAEATVHVVFIIELSMQWKGQQNSPAGKIIHPHPPLEPARKRDHTASVHQEFHPHGQNQSDSPTKSPQNRNHTFSVLLIFTEINFVYATIKTIVAVLGPSFTMAQNRLPDKHKLVL
jgi:hypothetical protein